ncbi:MAG: hypothetical protein HY720_23845 [Planctomycetes bacterium]|nr:hypothetical protein [Planctomycetota bacterium]
MRSTFIFPPPTDPRGPHPGLPYLAAVIRRAGAEVRMLDLEGFLSLLAPERLQAAASALREKTGRPGKEDPPDVARLFARADSIATGALEAVATHRHSERFYDSNEYNAARETIDALLSLRFLEIETVLPQAAGKGPR